MFNANYVEKGSILLCDFNTGFKEPEMVKRRLVVVISPKIRTRPGLCTVVALSTTDPNPVMPYHVQIDITPPLPKKWKSTGVWVKGDMVCAVGLHRLDSIWEKDRSGKRSYYYHRLADAEMNKIYTCVLHGMGLSRLVPHV